LARQKGASEDLVEAIQDRGGRAPLERLEAGWRGALEYADIVHVSGHLVTDELYARLAAAWDEGQIVEMTAGQPRIIGDVVVALPHRLQREGVEEVFDRRRH